jgi:hypothetical protein
MKVSELHSSKHDLNSIYRIHNNNAGLSGRAVRRVDLDHFDAVTAGSNAPYDMIASFRLSVLCCPV